MKENPLSQKHILVVYIILSFRIATPCKSVSSCAMPKGALLPHWECLTVFSRVCTQKQPQSNLTSLKMFGTKMLDNWRRSSRMIRSRPDVSNPSFISLRSCRPFWLSSVRRRRRQKQPKNPTLRPFCLLLCRRGTSDTRSTCSQPEPLNLEKPRPPTGQPAGRVRRLGL